MESKEIMGHLDFMIQTCRRAARSVKRRLHPPVEEAYRELVKMVQQRWDQEKDRAAQFERLAALKDKDIADKIRALRRRRQREREI